MAFAAALVAAQVLQALAGGEGNVLTVLPLVAAVGLACVPWLPDAVRARPLLIAALAFPLGALVLDVAIISATSAGLPLRRGVVLGLAALVVLVGVAGLLRRPAPDRAPRDPWWAWGALIGCLAAAAGLSLFVNASTPVTGNDWGKYLLYADEIRRHGSLLIHNPFWMLGVPFREDPGAPALYGALLDLARAPASQLAWGATGLLVLGVASVYAATCALFGTRAGAVATLFYAVVPSGFDMLAWHGVANFWAIALLPLVFWPLAMILRGERDSGYGWLLGLALVGVLAAHRLSFLVALMAIGLALLVRLVQTRGLPVRPLLRALGFACLFGVLVAWDIKRRGAGAGGYESYRAFLGTKFEWDLAAKDLTWPGVAVAVASLGAALWTRERRRDPALTVVLAALGAVLIYAYAWIVHIPGFYVRASYFLPLVLAIGVAAGLAAWRTRWVTWVALALIAAAAALTPSRAQDTRDFYRVADRAALRGFDLVTERIRPGQVVVTDRCTGFLSTWLLHAPILAALEPADIGPAAEVPFARRAAAILRGGAAGRRIARQLDARFLVLNPTCAREGANRPVPAYARPLYLSRHLAVFTLVA